MFLMQKRQPNTLTVPLPLRNLFVVTFFGGVTVAFKQQQVSRILSLLIRFPLDQPALTICCCFNVQKQTTTLQDMGGVCVRLGMSK